MFINKIIWQDVRHTNVYNFIFLLYILAGEKTVTVGECSSGDIAIFQILSRKK